MTTELFDAVVDRVAGLLNLQIGLRAEPTLRSRLRRSIRDEAAAQGEDPAAFGQALTAGSPAFQSLLNRVTVQETSFFRHPEHFDVLAREVLAQFSGPVTIWSAGCANGQEAYSLAMVLEEQGIAGSVLATDLSTAALQRTAAATYSSRELTGVSPARLARHFTCQGRTWQVNAALRDRVATMRVNLADRLPDRVASCQVVFCRNVLIYFSPDHARRFLDAVADALPEGGYLFLGSAEAIWPVSDRFDTLRIGDAFVYRRRSQVVRAAAPVDPPRPAASRPVQRGPAVRQRPTRPTRPPVRAVESSSALSQAGAADSVALLARAGQQALDAGEHQPAVVAFRKWAYLCPDDALAHLHLGLALELAGDRGPAQRAFAAAHQAVLKADPTHVENAIEGYTADELLRLLDAKRRMEAS